VSSAKVPGSFLPFNGAVDLVGKGIREGGSGCVVSDRVQLFSCPGGADGETVFRPSSNPHAFGLELSSPIMIFVLQMLCLASSFSRSITGPLDKGYELFPSRETDSISIR